MVHMCICVCGGEKVWGGCEMFIGSSVLTWVDTGKDTCMSTCHIHSGHVDSLPCSVVLSPKYLKCLPTHAYIMSVSK